MTTGTANAGAPSPRPRRWGHLAVEAAVLVGLVAAPFVLPWINMTMDVMTRSLIWGLFGLGFSILFGFTGLLSLGQAAFYGSGGFITAYLLTHGVLEQTLVALFIGTLAAAVLGLGIGLLVERRKGIYFAMITLAFGEMLFHLDYSTLSAYTGGENGMAGVPVPLIGSYVIRSSLGMYYFVAVLFFGGYLLARRVVASPVGRMLVAVRDNEERAKATGNATHLYKLVAIVLSAAYGGLAGGLLGIFQNYMPPGAFAFESSAQLLIQTVIGGAGVLLGPLVGASVWLYLQDLLQHTLGLGQSWKLVLGVIFVLLITFLPTGLLGEARRLGQWRWGRTRSGDDADADQSAHAVNAANASVAEPLPEYGPVILEARGVSKHFGGLAANHDIDFSVREFEVRALIGPNGAGKSTFFKMLAGVMPPSEGSIYFQGRDITGAGVTRVCQLGMSTSFQINQLFDRLSVRDNLMIPCLGQSRGRFKLDMLRRAERVAGLDERIDETLALVGLSHRADTPVSHLPYGEKRRVEIGLALATQPSLLLLDEPLAGMGPEERASTVALIKSLRKGRTVIVVEHDMDAVFELADRISVLVEGEILVEGAPEEIRSHPKVQQAYLGGVEA
ncbi:branched-chain amino acid ABC transporter ATP-binding protein/permease [Salinisphaera sp. T31B1]|uniref:branched-chain amino acid ABC transporter ATP-binding protein/permease n=1 Tax=Salinisphaera sp. T31B1 TaxID=727963 RepID=UPI00333FEE1F